MTKRQNKETEYLERMQAPSMTVDDARRLLFNYILNHITLTKEKGFENTEKMAHRLIGHAGIGKTAIMYQIARDLSEKTNVEWQVILLKAAAIGKDDIMLPYPVPGKDGLMINDYAMIYSDFVPKDPNSHGILVLDEASRANKETQQVFWQIENEHMVHFQPLPKGWYVIVTDNPDNPEYEMEQMTDAAGMRRTVHLGVEVNLQAFLSYAGKNNMHPAVIEFISNEDIHLYDFESMYAQSIYANPASWEKVSNILWGYEKGMGLTTQSLVDIQIHIAGLINLVKSRLFVEFMRSRVTIKAIDVIERYTDKAIRDAVKGMVKSRDIDTLHRLVTQFTRFLLSKKPKMIKKTLTNICNFLADIPEDAAGLYISEIKSAFTELKDDVELQKYIGELHEKLKEIDKETYMKKFYEPLSQLRSASKKLQSG